MKLNTKLSVWLAALGLGTALGQGLLGLLDFLGRNLAIPVRVKSHNDRQCLHKPAGAPLTTGSWPAIPAASASSAAAVFTAWLREFHLAFPPRDADEQVAVAVHRDGLDGDRLSAGVRAETDRLDLGVRAFRLGVLRRLAKRGAEAKRGEARGKFRVNVHAKSNSRNDAVVWSSATT